MELHNLVNNERGSGTVIIMVCMVLAAIFLGLLFFDFSNVFINKRVTQTGADAAAMAAAKTANSYMRIDLQDKTQEALDDLGDRWDDFFQDALDAFNAGTGPDPYPIEDLLDDFVTIVENELGKSMPGDVKAWILNHAESVTAETAMKFFFNDDEVNEMACNAVKLHLDEAEQEAEKYALKNQNDKLIEMTFIPEDFRIYVQTERKGKYTTVSDNMVPAVTSESSAKIGDPKGYKGKISCS
ncbi:pilus assembly protein TadG-related protein [Bacillus sp. Marseille-P3661]|uniref:pilus assembly protein TadG-related protein n=1 Tax=Bacillus sp. Marseille-P3661 TaxID=1936234 RepID=UPI000C83818C|nr:pilus assembly protein TadG-related protein [Bacillus sp. Marseille-P3661]